MQNTSDAGQEDDRRSRLPASAYQDIVGVWTIGYGDTGPDVGPGIVWTQEQCDSALTNRLHTEFEPAVNAAGPASQQVRR